MKFCAFTLCVFSMIVQLVVAGELPRQADDFVNSIGVGTHLGYDDTKYGTQFDTWKDRMIEAGIRHYRDGIETNEGKGSWLWARQRELAAAGISGTLIADIRHANMDRILSVVKNEISGCVIMLEGLNEHDVFGPVNAYGTSAPYWFKIERKGNLFSSYCSEDGTTWEYVGSSTITMSPDVLIGLAFTNHDAQQSGTAVFDNVSLSASPLTASIDVGDPALLGSMTQSDGAFTLTASGTDIWEGNDQFHFAYAHLQGDGEMVGRVQSIQSTHDWGKAGLMIREGLTANARNAFITLTRNNGIMFQHRTNEGAWTDVSYYMSWYKELTMYCKELHEKVSLDPQLSNIPIIGPSFVWPEPAYEKLGDLSSYVDYGCHHTYPLGGPPENSPLNPLSRFFKANDSLFGSKPMIVTESGYNTALNHSSAGNKPVSEGIDALYTVRMFLEYFRVGIVRTFKYELIDLFSDGGGNQENNFGILRNDLSRKPSFISIKSLIALLSDKGAPFATTALDYTIDVDTADVHHLLMQKRDGTYYLALWQIASAWDYNNRRSLSQEPIIATVSFGSPVSLTRSHEFDSTGQITASNIDTLPRSSISTSVGTAATIIEFKNSGQTTTNLSGNKYTHPRLSEASASKMYDLKGRLLQSKNFYENRANGVIIHLSEGITHRVIVKAVRRAYRK